MSKQSVLIQIAEAVRADLNAGKFSRSFRARRIYDPERELEALQTMRVDVIAGDIKSEPAGRGTRLGTFRVDVAVREKINPDIIENVDALGAFVEEIDEYFSLPPRRLSYCPAAVWQPPSEIVYPYLPRHIRDLRQFTSILRLTYKVALA